MSSVPEFCVNLWFLTEIWSTILLCRNSSILLFCGFGVYLKEIIDVNTGQVRLGKGNVILRSLAIGSCIAVAAYDSQKKIGALAHIMLPGNAPKKSPEKTRYAENAIDEMISLMAFGRSQKSHIKVCLVGAGNVLKRKDDTICVDNIRSTIRILEERNIPIRAAVLGGTERKSIFLDIETGCVTYSKGDGQKELLWKPETEDASMASPGRRRK
jgi:chemotaxis protein CheD